MIDKIKRSQIKLGNGHIVHRVMIESIECPMVGEKSKLVKHKMLEQICNSPDLTMCGQLDFETFLFKYISDRWVIELKATEEVPET